LKRQLNLSIFMLAIPIAIDLIELQPLRDFGSEADFTVSQKGGLPSKVANRPIFA
jgi:hypothetical protein